MLPRSVSPSVPTAPRPSASGVSAVARALPSRQAPAADQAVAREGDVLAFGQNVGAGEAPLPLRERRAAWVATVSNLDWPSKPGLTKEQAQAELRAMLDQLKALGMNAAILQVRPNGDALYASPNEPWSQVLTGTMGQDPGWDPLAFAIEEAHARGMELQAWINPFRARQLRGNDAPAAPGHITREHPEWVVRYGNQQWVDPGIPEARQYVIDLVKDLAKRYDLDAIHMDDYFYPYPLVEGGKEVDFPDAASYRAYQQAGGKLNRADWRRENVDGIVKALNEAIHAEKPDVRFSVSPFGIWKPGHPAGTTGLSQYDKLYADAKKWLELGWVDEFLPQLYWPIDQQKQAFPALLKWWAEQNPLGRVLAPGMYSSQVSAGTWRAREIERQIDITRATPGVGGHAHFSSRALKPGAPGGLADAIASRYTQPALPPAATWLDNQAPKAPKAELVAGANGERTLRWAPAEADRIGRWHVAVQVNGQWTQQILPGLNRSFTLPAGAQAVELAAVDRAGNLGERSRVELPAARRLPARTLR